MWLIVVGFAGNALWRFGGAAFGVPGGGSVAAGLITFGVFSFAEARWRRI